MELRVPFNYDILPQINSMGQFLVERDWIHYNRNIEIDTILFVLEGAVHVCEEDIDYTVKPGEAFFLKLNKHHWGKEIIKAGSRWFWLCFTPNTSGNITYLPKHIRVSNPKQMEHSFQTMLEIHRGNRQLKNSINSSSLYKIFLDLLEEEQREHNSKNSDIIDMVIKALSEDLLSGFDSERISEKVHMNYSHLCRVFKKETGMTINNKYNELKIDHAIEYITTTGLNISEIAYKLGFPNPYYFSRVFKNVTGISPKEYKKQIYR